MGRGRVRPKGQLSCITKYGCFVFSLLPARHWLRIYAMFQLFGMTSCVSEVSLCYMYGLEYMEKSSYQSNVKKKFT